jgi:hypothetical protein
LLRRVNQGDWAHAGLVAASQFPTRLINWIDRPVMDQQVVNSSIGELPFVCGPSLLQERQRTLNRIDFREKA